MILYLLGLPGSGKSTIGKELSQKLGLSLVDTDQEIENAERKGIDEIFAEKGEAYFREIEQKVLVKFSNVQNTIVSTGGGTPCFFDNMDIINKTGISLFLNVPIPVITKRLRAHSNQHRPLLQGKDKKQLEDFLIGKLNERISFYNKATFVFSEENITADKIIEKLKNEDIL